MKTSELRIGNYIRGASDHLKEERFTSATLVDLEYANLFEGIPLSKEWVSKLGFKNHGEWFCVKHFGAVLLSISLTNNKTTFGWNEEYEIENVKFVHQLQNLYFALTGEELTIKE